MSTPSRSALLTKMHKVLKKHYKPVAPTANRSVLETALLGCCLEDSTPPAAEEAYSALVDQFFDWNEVRVSTVRELAESFHMLRDPEPAAARVKKLLQSVFESIYAYDLESLRKQNLGQAVKTLGKHQGMTPFNVNYVVQTALGGHAIPINTGGFLALQVVGAISPNDAAKSNAPGMERAISKNKGVEFGSLLHQFGVDLGAGPYSPGPRKVLLEINPDCKDDLPKRPSKTPPAEPEAPAEKKAAKTTDKKKEAAAKKTATAKKPKAPAKKKAAKTTAAKKPTKTKKAATTKLSRRKPR